MTCLRIFNQVFLSLLMVIAITACDDDDATQPQTTATATTIHSQQDFLNKYMPKSEFHTINSDTTIVMAKGATFSFTKSSFRDASGNPVSGSIDLDMKEIYDKKGMIYSGRPTMTLNGSQLVSGGFFKVEATQNGNMLKASPFATRLSVPILDTINTPSMSLFAGESNAWSLLPQMQVLDSSNSTYNSFFPIGNWINCDYFYSTTGPKTTVEVSFTNNPAEVATVVYMAFNSLNSVMRIYNYNNISTWSTPNIPIGEDVTILAYTFDDDKIYMASKDLTITANITPVLNMAATSEAALIAAIEDL